MQVRLAGSVVLAVCGLAAWMQAGRSFAADDNSLSKQIANLESNNSGECDKAIAALAEMASGPHSAEVAVALAKELKSDCAPARYAAAKVLGDFGANAAIAIPELCQVLKSDEDPTVRAAAARTLGHVGTPTSEAVPALANAIVDKDARVRRAAVAAIHRIHPGPKIGLPLFIKVLSDADPATVGQALATVSELGEKVVPPMTEALKNEKARYWALLVLADIGPAAKAAAPDVKTLLNDPKPEVGMQAALTLAAIGPDAKDTAPELIAALNNPSNAVKFGAAYALGKIGAKEASPALEKLMAQSKSQFLSGVCAWALVELNPNDSDKADRAIKLLGDAVKSDKAPIRRGAVKALSELKVSPDRVAPILIPVLGDSDPAIVETASSALVKSGSKFAGEIGAKLGDEKSREGAVKTLGRMGAGAKDAVPAIGAALKTAPAPFKRELLFALAMIGPDSAPALSEVTAALKDASPEVQRPAIYALGKMGAAAKEAVPAIKENLKSSDPLMKMVCLWALLQIQGKDPALVAMAMPMLLEALNSDFELRRLEAVRTLGTLGPVAAPALDKLKELSETDSPDIRKAAAEAIDKITQSSGGRKPPLP